MTDTGPLFASSGDLLADRRYTFAVDLAARGDLAAAGDILDQTLAMAPGFAAAWFALGAVRERLGDRAGAVAAFIETRKADPKDYHGARLQLARLGAGEPAPPMTTAYLQRLFDQYAGRYDVALTEGLHYRGPEILRDALAKATKAAGRPLHFRSTLDLGCGTGLAGTVVRPLTDHLTGVDLSPAMIAQAESKGLYDRLASAELTEFLDQESTAGNLYDLVIAADVFVYVNDLTFVTAAVARVLAPNALLAFTAEAHPGDGVKLLPTLRYAFGENYLRGALAAAGIETLALETCAVRNERHQPVESFVVVAGPTFPSFSRMPI
jgi:predicted TPR repeat methyltransferase